MGRLKLGRLTMPAAPVQPKSSGGGLHQAFDYRNGFALHTFAVDLGWCGHAHPHPRLGVKHRSLFSALVGDESFVYETLENALFIDTETTGLGYGAGTFAFLVGIAYRGKYGWIGEQLFVTTPSEERSMLAYLKDKIESASTLVSYNGKSFDLPLLRCRFLLHQLECSEPSMHLDLYHVARGVLKDRLHRKRLVDLEVHLFEQVRRDDIDGAEIPNAYFRFLHRGEGDDISRVLLHNELDVITMPRLLTWLMAGVCKPFDEPLDELCFLERCFSKGAGSKIIERLVGLKGHTQGLESHRLALLEYQVFRSQDLSRALHVLKRSYVDTFGEMRGKMARRLAIHYEHDLKDFGQALDYAKETAREEGWSAHQKRLLRLQRKLERRSST